MRDVFVIVPALRISLVKKRKRARLGWQSLIHSEQRMDTVMLPQLLQEKINRSVNGAVTQGPLTSRYKKARVHRDYCHRIRLGDLKHWVLNRVEILLCLRIGWHSLLHLK